MHVHAKVPCRGHTDTRTPTNTLVVSLFFPRSEAGMPAPDAGRIRRNRVRTLPQPVGEQCSAPGYGSLLNNKKGSQKVWKRIVASRNSFA